MLKLVKKTALVGLGLGVLSVASIRRIGEKIAEEAQLSEEEGKKLIEDLLEQSEKSKAEIKETIYKTIKETVAEMDLATADDIDMVNDRLDDIEDLVSGTENNVNKSNETDKKSPGRPKKS